MPAAERLKEAATAFIDAHGGGEGFFPVADGLALIRTSRDRLPSHMLYRPALCVVVQGAKRVMLGDSAFDFGEMQSLIVSLELPVFSRVTRGSPEEPFLAVTVEFDVAAMREVMERLETPPRPLGDAEIGLFVADLDARLADCVLRLVRMAETPKAAPILQPSIMREIYFWLLTGPHGDRICRLVLPDSHTRRIADAIRILRSEFTRAIRIDELAAAARMSPSSFHQHFKTLTAMTPLQYQKHLRLLEARRLMAAGGSNVSAAAYEVGYESLAVQPRICPHVWRPAAARRRRAEGGAGVGGAGEHPPSCVRSGMPVSGRPKAARPASSTRGRACRATSRRQRLAAHPGQPLDARYSLLI